MPRSLLNEDGTPFGRSQLDVVNVAIVDMDDEARKEYRNQNSESIVQSASRKLLILSGPGTGKSYLFRDKIKFWLSSFPESRIYVSSFVRKLVSDLQAEIENDKDIDAFDVDRIEVSTLHGLARSVIERSHGIPEVPLGRHVRMLDSFWATVIWHDALLFHGHLDPVDFKWEDYKDQCDTDCFTSDVDSANLRKTYFGLLSFFNSAGFADSIWIAARAVENDTSLVAHDFWIVDEYQDFNYSEDRLIRAVTSRAQGVMFAGDDDQELYEGMKSSSAEIIRGYYNGGQFATAMLPFCNRCSYHICLASSHYISENRTADSVEKIFQPQILDEAAKKVQVVATIDPSSVVRYIKEFLDGHRTELLAHAEAIQNGETTDPFLLILSPRNGLPFFARKNGKGADVQIYELIEEWKIEAPVLSADYKRVMAHFQAGLYPQDNLLIRMVLEYAGLPVEKIHDFLNRSLSEEKSLFDVVKGDDATVPELLKQTVTVFEPPLVSSAEIVRRLATIMTIQNPERLEHELEQNPISVLNDDFDIEVIDALETATTLPMVELMSIAKSKGLSAQHVMVLGCDGTNMLLDDISPLSFYVAMTRARESLHLVTSLKARGSAGAATHFAYLPEEHCDFLSFTTKGATDLGTYAGFVQQLRRWNRMMTLPRKKR